MTAPSGDRSWEYLPDTFGGVESISDAHVIREKGLFLLTDQDGNVPRDNGRGLGLYCADTRHVSTFDFSLNGSSPVVLLSTSDSGYSMEQVMGNHRAATHDGFVVGRCTVELVRRRYITDKLEERMRITNYNPFPVTVRPVYEIGADFADTFEVRGHQRLKQGELREPEVSERAVRYCYTGLDGRPRHSEFSFDNKPEALTATRAAFAFDLEPRQSVELMFQISVGNEARQRGAAGSFQRVSADHSRWRETFTAIDTDNEIFNKVLERSFTDLRMLWTADAHGNGYFAAGTPWFDALFGRDSVITAMSVLPYRPELARECLFLLGRQQGTRIDPANVEEPGKILHEVRDDELSTIGELPYARYYGSVDSTPLFLLLAGEYFSWTSDLPAMRALRKHLANALQWVRHYGAPDDDGYLKYRTDSPTGLRNQGWKDSENAIIHADGSLCEGPIALAEVQGYLYAALLRLAPVFEALGDQAEASRLRLDASALRRRFRKDFWSEEGSPVPLALDGQGRAADVMSSNAGQVLWSRILEQGHAGAVRDRLFGNDMFTGWGIRTLSSEAPGFNPVGYHLGTIWPHDNAIIASGLKRHGFDEEVGEVATALFDTACAFPSFRLPEVYGGQPRSAHQPPVPYPVACRPQAWAAASMLSVMQSVLGLAADAAAGKLYVVRPRLPYWLQEVRLRGLRVGGGSANLTFTRSHGRTRVHAEPTEGLQVVQAASWPAW
ncbi:MAG TPA: glycogen debranching N-terminal domain-containing protein [Dehalococcoidia bacterium]